MFDVHCKCSSPCSQSEYIQLAEGVSKENIARSTDSSPGEMLLASISHILGGRRHSVSSMTSLLLFDLHLIDLVCVIQGTKSSGPKTHFHPGVYSGPPGVTIQQESCHYTVNTIKGQCGHICVHSQVRTIGTQKTLSLGY